MKKLLSLILVVLMLLPSTIASAEVASPTDISSSSATDNMLGNLADIQMDIPIDVSARDAQYYCEQCGGEAVPSEYLNAWNGHLLVCPHYVAIGDWEQHTPAQPGSRICGVCGQVPPEYDGHCPFCPGYEPVLACYIPIDSTDSMGHAHIGVCEHGTECGWSYSWTVSPCTTIICDVCGATIPGTADGRHQFETTQLGEYVWEYVWRHTDEQHWVECVLCGKHTETGLHIGLCDQPNVCSVCGAPSSGESVMHWVSDEIIDIDEKYHYNECLRCHMRFREEHGINCIAPDRCAVCYMPMEGQFVYHQIIDSECIEWLDDTYHQLKCKNCGEIRIEKHERKCDWNDFGLDGLCYTCRGPAGGISTVSHYPNHVGVGEVYQWDENEHWQVCMQCGEQYGYEVHYTDDGDPEDICSVCGRDYIVPTATPIPDVPATPAVTELPADPAGDDTLPADTPAPDVSPTPAATKRPAVPVSGDDTMGKPALNGDSLLSRFQNNSDAAADGDISFGDNSDTITLVIENATEEPGYELSVLTIYAAGARDDSVQIILSSQYAPEAIQGFQIWQGRMTGINELQETDSYRSFVDLTRALLQSLLPEQSVNDVDAIIVALLQSYSNGGLKEADIAKASFNDDIDGDIIGYLTVNGYEIFLVLRPDCVELLIR